MDFTNLDPRGRYQRGKCLFFLPLAALLLAPASSSAEEAAPPPESAKATPAGDAASKAKRQAPVLHLRDKSRISGTPKFEGVTVETQYGTLTVPRDQLVRIRFVRRIPTELRDKIQQLINDLGDADFDKRDAATSSLREIGAPALDLLRKAAKSTNEEVKNRAGVLVSEISEKQSSTQSSEDDLVPQLGGSDDEVVTAKMTVKGHVQLDEVLVESNYGELKVSVGDLTAITFRSAGPSAMKVNVTMQHQPPSNWLDTKLDLEKGQKVKIDASGQTNVRNYGIVSGPEGNRDYSSSGALGNFPPLALVGKIGKRGQPFLVGSSYTGKAKTGGRLYLGITTFTPYPAGAAGGYEAKVHTLDAE